MRNVLFIILITLVFVSCEQKITDAFAYSGVLEISETEIKLNSSPYSKTIVVKGVLDWEVDTSSMGKWCGIMAVKNYNGNEYITVSVDSNETVDNRETKFQVISGNQRVDVNVLQIGNTPQVIFSTDSLVIGLDTNYLKINFVSNIEYEIVYNEDWYQVEEVDYEGDKRLLISVSKNLTGAQRKGEIIFKEKNASGEWIFTLRQLHTKAPYVPVGVEELDPNAKVLPISAVASSELEGKGIEKSYDGDKITHFQSTFQNITEPVVLEYRFDGSTSIDYINYCPYEGDTGKSFFETEIWVQREGEEYELIKTHYFINTGEQVVIFENSIEKPTGIKFVVKSTSANNGSLLVAACAEMEFYSASMRYADIFANPVYSELVENVSLEKIFAIEDPVFRNIAYHLYYNSYESGRVMQCSSFTDLEAGGYNFNGSYGGLNNVTGIAVKAGELIPIFADQIKQDFVYATIFNPAKPQEFKRYRIVDGVNKIEADYDGHLYINFTSNENKNVNVHIAGGKYNGYFDLSNETTYDLSNNTTSSYIDVVGDHVHLIFEKDYLSGDDLSELLAKYDKIVRSQQLFMGLEKYEEDFDNRVLFLQVKDVLEIKYNNHYIQCPDLEMNNLVEADKIRDRILWDLAVAVGTIHNHVALTWKGVKFTTPKLFALATQEAFGTSLEVDANKWYAEGFKSIVIPEEKLADLRDDYYDFSEKIVPFWQLHLYTSRVLGDNDFYKDILHNLRNTSNSSEYLFMYYCQDRLKLDLRSFFKRWGFSMTVRNSNEKAPEALVYLTNNNVDVFKEDNAEPSASGYIKSGTQIRIENPQNTVAYLVKHTFIPVQVFDTSTFNVDNWKDSMRIFALGEDGIEVEILHL